MITETLEDKTIVYELYTSHLSVNVISLDGLSCEKWVWYYRSNWHIMILDTYLYMEKKTKRHGFKVIKRWDRLTRQYSNMDNPMTPDLELIEKAKKYFVEQLKFSIGEG